MVQPLASRCRTLGSSLPLWWGGRRMGLGERGVTGAGSMHIGQMSNDTYKYSLFHTKVLSFSRSVSSLVGT